MATKTVTETAPIAEGDYVRPLEPKDVRMVKMLIGQGYMEGLTRANKRVMLNPVLLVIAIVLGLYLNRLLGFTYSKDVPLSSFTPFVGPCLILLPTFGGIEYLQRWPFVAGMRALIGGADLVAPSTYYNSAAGSSVLVFEHNGELAGAVALDGRAPGADVPSVLGAAEGELSEPGLLPSAPAEGKKQGGGKGKGSTGKDTDARLRQRTTTSSTKPSSTASSPSVIEIRHLTVDGQLRKNRIGTELVAAALDAAFAQQGVKRVIAFTSPFTDGGERLWTKVGFSPVEAEAGWRKPAGMGLFKWTGRWLAVDEVTWQTQRSALYVGKKAE